MATLWFKSSEGLILLNGSGLPYYCDECPCPSGPTECCSCQSPQGGTCDATLTSLTVHLINIDLSTNYPTCGDFYTGDDVVTQTISNCPSNASWTLTGTSPYINLSYLDDGVAGGGAPTGTGKYTLFIRKTLGSATCWSGCKGDNSPVGWYCLDTFYCSNLCNRTLFGIYVD